MAASEASEANNEMRGILDPLIHSHRVVPQARRSTRANRTRGQNIVLSEQRTHAYRRVGARLSGDLSVLLAALGSSGYGPMDGQPSRIFIHRRA